MGAERDRALPRSLAWSWCSGNCCSLVHKHILAKPCCSPEPQSPQLCSGQVDFGIADYKIPNVSECGFFACPLQRFLVAENASPAPQEQLCQVVWQVWEAALVVAPESGAPLAAPQVFPERRRGEIPGTSQSVGCGS